MVATKRTPKGILTDAKFMARALDLAGEALAAGEFPVGCVLVAGGEVVGQGKRCKSVGEEANELDHAEVMALRDWLMRGRPGGGRGSGPTAYCTLEPCLMCLGALILNGVGRIVYAYEDVMGGTAGFSFAGPLTGAVRQFDVAWALPASLYQEAGVEIVGGVSREESLRLFQGFFSDPSRDYWRGSILASYTLRQDSRIAERGDERNE